MIQGIYETHIFVEDLERSIAFYRQLPGLTLAHREVERSIAFFWVGGSRKTMLGLWEKPKDQIDIRHFAFQTSPEFVLDESVPFLHSINVKGYNFLKDGTERPMVFAWMPAIAIYFDDPDGHALEFIGLLDGEPKPEMGVIGYEEWKAKN